jgi:peroxiredoxin Q/BCP
MLSDQSGEARKAYSVGRGLMGISEGRVTFFIDSQGVVRYALPTPCLLSNFLNLRYSEVFDSVINFNGHIKAVSRALEEYRKASKPAETPTAADAAEGA